jgi:hypothetical protein
VEAQVEAYQVSYPSIGHAQQQVQAQAQATVISYASMTAKAPSIKTPVVKTPAPKPMMTKKSWADWSDSDDDDDDEEEVASDCECDYCDF